MNKELKNTLNAFDEKKNMLILPLQFFAEKGTEATKTDDTKEDEDGEEESDKDTEKKPEVFTRSEVDSMISNAVNKASKRIEKKYEALLETVKEESLAEGETLASLSEKDRELKKLEAREKAVAEKEAKILRSERLLTIKENLKEPKLPESLAEVLVIEEDDEKVLEIIKTLSKDFEDAIAERVKNALNQTTPKGDKVGGNAADTSKDLVESIAEANFKSRSIMPKNDWFK